MHTMDREYRAKKKKKKIPSPLSLHSVIFHPCGNDRHNKKMMRGNSPMRASDKAKIFMAGIEYYCTRISS